MDETTWSRFRALATEQRVRPLVREALREHGGAFAVPEPVSRALDGQCRRIAARILHRQAELVQITQALAASGIPVVVLKGACLANLVYRDVALREMNDLDLLVRRQDLKAAVDVVVSRGYQPIRPSFAEVDARARQHVVPLVKGMATVEIHWNVTLPGQPFTIDPAELWSRAVPQVIGGVGALRLGLEDLLLHVCLHASYHHRFECGLRPACDVDAIIRRYRDDLDWEAVRERCERWRWSKGVYLVLALAHGLVGADVPSDALSRLPVLNGPDAVASAEQLLWTTTGEIGTFVPNLAPLGAHASWSRKIRHGLARLVPAPSELAFLYGARPGTPWLPLYYVRRIWDVVRRHGRSAIRIVARPDPALLALAARRDRMRQWLLE